MSRPNILDASALLALIQGEIGADFVSEYLPYSIIGAVNVSEALAKFILTRGDPAPVIQFIAESDISVVSFDERLAHRAAKLVGLTKAFGASLGDRACLALAQQETRPVLTSDMAWRDIDVGVEIIFIR